MNTVTLTALTHGPCGGAAAFMPTWTHQIRYSIHFRPGNKGLLLPLAARLQDTLLQWEKCVGFVVDAIGLQNRYKNESRGYRVPFKGTVLWGQCLCSEKCGATRFPHVGKTWSIAKAGRHTATNRIVTTEQVRTPGLRHFRAFQALFHTQRSTLH